MGSIGGDAPHRRPRVAVTLGDPAGIGPELVAKILSDDANLSRADVLLLASEQEVSSAEAAAGGLSKIPLRSCSNNSSSEPLVPSVQLLPDDEDDDNPPNNTTTGTITNNSNNSSSSAIPLSQVSKAAGDRTIHQLRRAVALAAAGAADAIVFAPLNKSSLKLAGMREEDELRWFAKQLGHRGATSEINIAGDLWTARVTSHVGVEKVAGMVTRESTLEAIELLHRLRWESGIESPRLAVCALNPHAGENGNFGRHEIDHIGPAVRDARQQGMDVSGPFPCDTIFLKRDSFDGIVTMYHDQGQIAMKLLGFDGGVTVQGGLPVVIATPAHGTAFDIVGKNVAGTQSMQNAFDIAVTMAERRLAAHGKMGSGTAVKATVESSREKLKGHLQTEDAAHSQSCC